jgi:hypothetical protein
MASHPVLDQLDIALRDRVPTEPVNFAGEWSNPSRRTYKSEAQLGTGAGPFADVVDFRWRGTLTCAGSIGGIAFLVTTGNLYWVKGVEVSSTLSVDVSLHAYADYRAERATFTAGMAGACLPGIPVAVSSDSERPCRVEQGVVMTGQVSCLAQANSAGFFVLLFPRGLLKIGRKRLWHVRDEITSSFPASIRELLTHRRTGRVLSGPV